MDQHNQFSSSVKMPDSPMSDLTLEFLWLKTKSARKLDFALPDYSSPPLLPIAKTLNFNHGSDQIDIDKDSGDFQLGVSFLDSPTNSDISLGSKDNTSSPAYNEDSLDSPPYKKYKLDIYRDSAGTGGDLMFQESTPINTNNKSQSDKKKMFEFKSLDGASALVLGGTCETSKRSPSIILSENFVNFSSCMISSPKISTTLRDVSENRISKPDIKIALSHDEDTVHLVGDFSKPCCLPLVAGHHTDLRCISADTVADALKGHYSEQIDDLIIIDCRYPYEYEGGHVNTARNIYTRETLVSQLIKDHTHLPSIRTVLVFHCEFSSERGPRMMRFLRSHDRELNKENYPFLTYPELYLMNGGYRDFYHRHKELCIPPSYLPMRHKDYAVQLFDFRGKFGSRKGRTRSRTALRL